ncbi:MAG: sulfatase-like hydrolase/transferase [Bradymonadaceae bacterium]
MKEQIDKSSHELGQWYRGALIVFALFGTLDWALALFSASGTSFVGMISGWLLFVALWVLGGSLWAPASGAMIWAATGRASGSFGVAWLLEQAGSWWGERGTERDSRRVALVISGALGVAIFLGTSVALTAHLIENRNGPWVIAAASLVGQAVLVIGAAFGVAVLRRILASALIRGREKGWLGWLHAPAITVAALLGAIAVAVAGLVRFWDIFLAVEGPTLALVVAALILHSPAVYFLGRRPGPPLLLRQLSLAMPVVALLLTGFVSQQPDARRLVVLHGETAKFAFNTMQRHADLDRFFMRSDCPPLGPDGLPVDGTSNEEYEAQCLDPNYDRPIARAVIPPFERPEFDQPPSFLFITWDSVRVDRLSYSGHERETTPHLDEFARKSLVFDRAFAADSGTGPSFWSLMAGKTPFQVALTDGDRFPPTIKPSEKMLGELLEETGYKNEAVMCGSVFANKKWGIRRGFDTFGNVCGRHRHFLAPYVVEASTRALGRLGNGDDPFFLWVHFYDPHIPYTNHPEIGWGEGREDRYDEELRYTDEHMKKVIDTALDLGTTRPLYIIFGADHGEGFGEHGTDPHARNLYRVVTQVPLIIHGPGVQPRHVEPPVSLNDIYPTVLDLAGIEIPEESTMVSQVPVLFGAAPDAHRMVFQENSYSRPRRHTRAVVYDRYHYIMDLTTNTNELYDYIADPIERRNLIGTRLIEERIMRQALIRFLATSEIPEGMSN